MTDDRVARLPKWAQGAFKAHERLISELRERLEDIPESPKTAVWVDPYGYHRQKPRAVADRGQYVRFALDGLDGHKWVDVRVSHDGSEVDVMASTGLQIELRASNTCGLRVIR